MPKLVRTLILIVACAGWNLAATVAKPASKPPLKPTSPDVQIEHKIQQKFAKSKINAEHFTVSVKDGVATINGKTTVIQHKGVATRLAKSGGAVSVNNHIQISEEAKTKAAAQLAQGRSQPESTPLPRAKILPPPGAK